MTCSAIPHKVITIKKTIGITVYIMGLPFRFSQIVISIKLIPANNWFAVPNNGHSKYPPDPNPLGPLGPSTNRALNITAMEVATCTRVNGLILYVTPSSAMIYRISRTELSRVVAAKLTTITAIMVRATWAGIPTPVANWPAPRIKVLSPLEPADEKEEYVAIN